jgi:tartrate dehydrogenase/decarboxylase/D-malate dehydrogenase
MKTYRIATIPGDGIGKEVVPAAGKCWPRWRQQHSFQFTFENFDWGGDYYRRTAR